MGAREKMEELVRRWEERRRRCGEEPVLSHSAAAAEETARSLCARLEAEGAAALLQSLRKELLALRQACRAEEERPTFDWYNEHYHALVLEGRCEAYEAVIRLLEEDA